MTRLSQQSIEHARDSAFAEHRRFLRRLDHELKNPLMALRAGLSSLAMTNPNSHQYQIIETLSAEAIRLSRLVVDLRKLAELEATALEIHAIDITAFLNELQELTRERLEDRGRQFHVECPAELTGSFTGDQDLLLLAIHNLLDNAIKYTQEGNTITLKIWSEDDDLVIQVEDTGRGILPDDIPLVWEELYRGQNTSDVPGTGIGLALVRAIVERHYGSANLSSQPEQGTKVTLRLPLD
jgi:signal transduction histidine kinase